MQVVTGSQSKNLIFFEFPRVSPGALADKKARGLWVRDWGENKVQRKRLT